MSTFILDFVEGLQKKLLKQKFIWKLALNNDKPTDGADNVALYEWMNKKAKKLKQIGILANKYLILRLFMAELRVTKCSLDIHRHSQLKYGII